ncbi:hypothetical protein PRIPAC_78265 [Pristionchus pacificus]|uniref:Uncharacterized protein n=1 Tax=Pristionchus pacificus TaxID=54126 RepID=A0A2A6BH21_PRIPA|nr:hypothetical protein PRIPAC_78265 [Pristionchus pacificus]|eukprot:PDM65194.1 hypothetical protein PRIPAC_52136 [Pristionchus pacificus]
MTAKKPSALDVFDYCQTIVIFLLLIITIPLASYVYSKLLFSRPFSESYTFKLIVFQGTTELLASVVYLFVFQLTSFEFMRGFYHSVQKLGLSTLLAALNTIIGYLALHSSLFVSLNRAKTMLFLRRNDVSFISYSLLTFFFSQNDFILFIISICLSFIVTIPVTIHYCTSISSYETIQIGDDSILVPYNFVTVTIWRTIASITSSVISVITLIMNIILCFLITRERKFINMTDLQKFNVEKGLVITSIVSFATYMLHFIDNQISVQFSVVFCGYAKWKFIGIKSVPRCIHTVCAEIDICSGKIEYNHNHSKYYFRRKFENYLISMFVFSFLRHRFETLDVFDYCQTIGISFCLIITIPIACYVYLKIIFAKPFSESYIFKLIQWSYRALEYCHVPYCLPTYQFLTDFIFFLVSIFLTTLLTLPSLLHYIFTTMKYIEIELGPEIILIPDADVTNEIFRTINNYISSVISVATLVVNILLCILITREKKFINTLEMQKFNVEKGLVITSIVSYITFLISIINSLISNHFNVLFCGYAQWLTQGIKAMAPFWCLIIFTPSVRYVLYRNRKSRTVTIIHAKTLSDGGCFTEMPSAIEVFDYCQTVFISLCLMLTNPMACYVYSKLVFVRPFAESYTFKLIVFNGTNELLNIIMYLFVFQLSSFSFMRNFYLSVQKNGLATLLAIINTLFGSLALHSSLFVALNRAKTMLFFHKNDSDLIFMLISLITSMCFTIPTVLHYCFTTMQYIEIDIEGQSLLIPDAIVTNEIFRTITTYINTTVSIATLVVNFVLCFLITHERKLITYAEKKRFKVERALAITSIVSYVTYMIYFINSLIAEHWNVLFSGYAQWLFQGIRSMTPFWCLMALTPSVRRLVYNAERTRTITAIQVNTLTA